MRTLVIIPTYNERENVGAIVGRVRASVPEAEILVVDDGSPDGTGELADALAATDPNVHVMHRAGKDGLGAAYRAGMQWALDAGFQAIVEMDADGSHRPEELPRLLGALRQDDDAREGADVVLGSRWVEGGGVVNWPAGRKFISRGGSAYSRLALGLPVRDVTGGYRAFTSDALRRLHFERTESQGYCFQIDMTRRAFDAGLRVVEVPITFVERERGASKMGGGIVVEAMLRVTVWGLTGLPHRFRKRPVQATAETATRA
ncbi:dolichol-phosphate mannosyltransferase [Leifsonia sp. ku-ls]|nr:dolichol-phosphate mannosyltransferase [Leifsonia sp. ku-ls]